jgi:hypothetical protein
LKDPDLRWLIVSFGLACSACGGASPAAPDAAPSTVVQQQGWLCTQNPAGGNIPTCSGRGFTEKERIVSFAAPWRSRVEVLLLFRDMDYNEWVRLTLQCNGVDVPLTRTGYAWDPAGPPDYFYPNLGDLWPAVKARYVSDSRVQPCNYQLRLAFDLRSPPYSPYELTVNVVR